MEAAAASGIERLPEELLAAAIALTSPPDACRAAAVSRTFRAAADSDAVWSRFLPGDLPELDEAAERACSARSKKALFQCLSHKPVLLPCRLLCLQLDRVTGDECYMFSKLEREEDISWDEDDTPPPEPEWIDLGCGDVERNNRFQSFQSAFCTN